MEVRFKRLSPQAPVPAPARPGDAGVDLVTTVAVELAPGERQAVPTGIAVAIPEGHAGLVIPRSGHALRLGIGVVNGPGLIDSGYRGEVKVILINHGSETVRFSPGERIAQLMVVPVPEVTWSEVAELEATERGDGGFGSTGS
ncbi:MAG: dUTP diphosphatase [Actinomycetes bacterium]|nr:MAG: dUTP diphosphatase [Actinomycetota bacterium]